MIFFYCKNLQNKSPTFEPKNLYKWVINKWVNKMHIFDLKIFLLWIGMTLTHQGPIKPAMKSWPPKQILLKKGTFSSQNQPQTPASDST